jgi:hypothetical protein
MPIAIVIAVGVAIWGLISGLLVYIWRSDRSILVDRLEKIEQAREKQLSELIANPVLTIMSHGIICNGVWKHLNEKLDAIRVEIRNAILEASKNGK